MGETNLVTIRRGQTDDAENLARLATDTFCETFGHLYAPADLAAFLGLAYTPEAFGRDLADPAQALWLLEAEGRPIGYAQAGPCGLPHPEVTPACLELKRIYLLRPWQGGGRGSRLLDAALAWLERDGPRRLWLGVWSQNLGAQRLYAAKGFEKVGEYDFRVGAARDHDFIFRRG